MVKYYQLLSGKIRELFFFVKQQKKIFSFYQQCGHFGLKIRRSVCEVFFSSIYNSIVRYILPLITQKNVFSSVIRCNINCLPIKSRKIVHA